MRQADSGPLEAKASPLRRVERRVAQLHDAARAQARIASGGVGRRRVRWDLMQPDGRCEACQLQSRRVDQRAAAAAAAASVVANVTTPRVPLDKLLYEKFKVGLKCFNGADELECEKWRAVATPRAQPPRRGLQVLVDPSEAAQRRGPIVLSDPVRRSV
eukprot:6174755-Pleurochrysis_carterae.AAC.2